LGLGRMKWVVIGVGGGKEKSQSCCGMEPDVLSLSPCPRSWSTMSLEASTTGV
jgi:hypothetical protein